MKNNLFSKYGRLATSLPSDLGDVYFVHKSGSTYFNELQAWLKGEDGKEKLHTTIASAMDSVVANHGDTILVLPGHTETLTAALALDVAGVKVIGLGQGADRPTLTINGAVDGVNMSAASSWLENILFAAPGTDAQTSVINVDAANCTVKKIEAVGSTTAKNIVDMITVTANADDLLLEDIWLHNSTVAVNSFLSLEGAASRVTVRRFRAFGDVATAGVIDAAKVDYLIMEDVDVAVVGTTKPACTLDSNPEGFAKRCNWAGTHGTLATNGDMGNLMRLFDVKVLEETDGSKQGALIPAVDVE